MKAPTGAAWAAACREFGISEEREHRFQHDLKRVRIDRAWHRKSLMEHMSALHDLIADLAALEKEIEGSGARLVRRTNDGESNTSSLHARHNKLVLEEHELHERIDTVWASATRDSLRHDHGLDARNRMKRFWSMLLKRRRRAAEYRDLVHSVSRAQQAHLKTAHAGILARQRILIDEEESRDLASLRIPGWDAPPGYERMTDEEIARACG